MSAGVLESTSKTSIRIVNNKHCASTHLYLNRKGLENIYIPLPCNKLKVLYLHNNKIRKIQNLQKFQDLTQLYLQWNRISKMENLNCLKNLRKLYLGFNQITRLENIEELKNLEELHIEKQNIGVTEFTFDKTSLLGVSKNLLKLNVSKLNLKGIEPLSVLIGLSELHASENKFTDAKELGAVLGNLPLLLKVEFKNCPAQKDTHYRDKITAGSVNLEYLDGKKITALNRVFVKKLEEVKQERLKKSKSEPDTTPKEETEEEIPIKPVHSLELRPYAMDDLTYQSWNSLNSVRKPKRTLLNRKLGITPKIGYSLQGKHINK